MKIDRPSRQLAKKYFRACRRPDGGFDERGIREIVQLLIDQKPRNHLAVLSYLYRLVELALEENTVRVESAAPLPDRGASIFTSLEQHYGPAARTSYEENPALLGGLRIRRGNNIWDGSLSGRLDRLQQALS
ncbi:MAG: F0F1 ATP synthase subunit delta [Methylacidiphilales bacterium]|nr:F0F1 ATP synthase subunit delta [Candidatus Methylacidiphilales bacterium]